MLQRRYRVGVEPRYEPAMLHERGFVQRWINGHNVVSAITMRGNLPIRVNPRSGLTSTCRSIGQTLELVPVAEHNARGMTMNYGRMTNWHAEGQLRRIAPAVK